MVEVVAALIWDNNKFMICQRPAHKARALLWEFVGGKVEPGETKEQALIRECQEELAITISVGDVFMDVIHKYKSEGKLIVSTNASYMQFSDIGDEIYGIHFLVEFFKGRDEYILIVSDPSGQYSEYYRDEKLKNVCIFKQKHSYASLLSYSDIMIRATATDGDSLSVREALDQGVRVIATDCVDRPDGVLLYKYNDEESLMKSLNINECQKRLHNSQKDVVNSIVSLYQGLLTR